MIERVLPGVGGLQNIHPLVVHFPIAFLYGAALVYAIAWFRGSEGLQWTALWILILGAIGAAVSLATGLYADSGVMIAESVRRQLLDHHKHLMIAASILTGLLTVWALIARPMPSRGRYVFLAGLLALLWLIASGADLGGQLVYGYNAGGDACSQPIDLRR
ncbi:MAG: hypothetical protein Q7S58_10870 [Candidatus Binatus sp.]|uniref:DUF2231 domain-containing protein n=1 Tax=Candidatus Binatus sp. TaxID=2811406 RepID=UPI002726C1FC|nr:DUF2231 domain-containing protein [Candidatus Binatus sp.]MDO8432897.1 hypothetical protein [Candidatus Binatus sp.]